MYLCVSDITHQEGESSCINVLVVYQEGESSCICVLVVMYLCVSGIDCAPFYDFLMDFRTVPTV